MRTGPDGQGAGGDLRAPGPGPAGAPPDEDGILTVNGPKLVRMESTIRSLIEEIRSVAPTDAEAADIGDVVTRLLTEVGSCLPDPLLEELRRLVSPLTGAPVDADTLRVALAQLDGWVAALVAEALAAASDGQIAVA